MSANPFQIEIVLVGRNSAKFLHEKVLLFCLGVLDILCGSGKFCYFVLSLNPIVTIQQSCYRVIGN